MKQNDKILQEHGGDLYGLFDLLMERSGKTRYQVAKETGIIKATLSRYASREVRPPLESLCLIANLASFKLLVNVAD